MQKQLGSILIVAGTCIGAGTLALPLAIAPLGLIPGIFIMLGIWILAYYTSLIHLELNLHAGAGLDLGQLANRFSGRSMQCVSTSLVTLLMYALMTAYLYIGSSIIQKMLTTYCAFECCSSALAIAYATGIMSILLLPITLVDYANRILLLVLFGCAIFLVGGLMIVTNWSNLPLFATNPNYVREWARAVPIIFTSFGFQVIFHTLVTYCNKNATMLKRAFFWGSLIPVILYIVWSSTVLASIYSNNQLFYAQLEARNISVADLIAQLSLIAQWPTIQLLAWIITLLAITTSALGVGTALIDSLKSRMTSQTYAAKTISLLGSIMPALLLALIVPNAFITVLGFAGMILVCIAIHIPIYLLFKARITNWHYPALDNIYAIVLCMTLGYLIICAELYTLYN